MNNYDQGIDVRIHNNAEFTRPHLCKFGNHVAIDYGFYCTTQLIVGDYVHVSSHVSVIGGMDASLTLHDFSHVSTGAKIVCSSDKMLGDGLVGPFIPEPYQDTRKTAPVVFERFAGTGANAVILPGVTLAEGSIVGANSLVISSTEPWTIYAGTPAKPIKQRNKENIYRYAEELGYQHG